MEFLARPNGHDAITKKLKTLALAYLEQKLDSAHWKDRYVDLEREVRMDRDRLS